MKTTGKVVIALLVIGVLVSLVTLFNGNRPVGSENLVGKPLPDFAAPLAGSGIDGDSNVYTPAVAKANDATPACDVKIKGSVNSCDGLQGAAVLLFWNTGKAECVSQVDSLQAALKQNPKVNAIALAFENSMDTATAEDDQHHWRLPVAVDPDGAVASLYSVTGCPSVFYAQDGVIREVKLGVQSPAQLSAAIESYTDG